MDLHLGKSTVISGKAIKISGSKSESNRLLLLQALFPELTLGNISNSDDSDVMQKAIASSESLIDIHHAGTAMRFLTAYFSIQNNREVILTGSPRMKERPIGILVDALRHLGAQIEYLENDGFPPLKISGKELTNNIVTLSANVSSQYISALLLIAPKLENGIVINLEGTITSLPYLMMTLGLLNEIGIKTEIAENRITVFPNTQHPTPNTIIVESDWSSASYFYSIIALSEVGTEITLSSYKQNSFQGDSALAEIYESFGVTTKFTPNNNEIVLKKTNTQHPISNTFNLNNTPDIAQTIAVTCFGLGISCHLTGLHTLKIKETDRLEALKTELQKLGAIVSITKDTLTLNATSVIAKNISISTYNDHRMAMSFAPLALKTDLIINNAEVVSKSYPDFWNDLKAIGFQISE